MEDLFGESIQMLNRGRNIMIFPEGRRMKNKLKHDAPVKAGVAYLAAETGSKVVPLHIKKFGRGQSRTSLVFGKSMLIKKISGNVRRYRKVAEGIMQTVYLL